MTVLLLPTALGPVGSLDGGMQAALLPAHLSIDPSRRVHLSTGHTHQPDSPIGLDLKRAKLPSKIP